MKKTKEKKVLNVKKWEFTFTTFDDGTTLLERINDGFNGFELLGLAHLASLEIKDILRNDIKVDTIERKVILD